MNNYRTNNSPGSDNPLESYTPHPYQSLNIKGKIVTVNEAWLNTLGYDRPEVEGRYFSDFLPNVSSEVFDSRFAEFKSEGHISNIKFEMKCEDGNTIFVSYDGVIEYGENGEFVRTHCQFTDITELNDRKRDLQRYERLINSMLASACIYDEAGQFDTVNQYLADWYGETREELEGKSSNLIPLIKEQHDGDPYQKLLDGKSSELSGEVEAEFPGHGHAVLEYRLTPLKVEGSIEGVVGVTRDITERTEREREIRQAREEYQELFNGMNDTAWVIDHTGNILAVNDAAVDQLGYTQEELTGMSPHEIDEGLDDGEITALIKSMPYDGIQVFETVHRTKEGKEIPVEISSSLITYRGDESILSIARDITERKRKDQELQRQKRRYESLFNSIRDAILVADTDRKIINCNPAFEELFEYDLEEIEGKPMEYVYESAEEFEKMGEEIAGHIDNPQFTTILNYEKKSGQVFPGETNVFYLRNHEGTIVGFIGLIRDVSDKQKRMRQMKIMDRVLRHNINNELNIVLGYADLIAEDNCDPIQTQAEKILEVTNKLLETADKQRKITSILSEQPSHIKIELISLIEHTISPVSKRHPEAEIQLEITGEARIEATDNFGVAIDELLDNAIRYAEDPNPVVELRMNKSANHVALHVADNGPGIPEMEQKILTEEKEIEPLYHGSGLGLWLVNVIVKRSNGILEFSENEPRGSVVTIRIPRAD